MAPRSARLTSIDVLRAFAAQLRNFEAEGSSALDTLEMEGRRPAEWIENDRARYWPAEARKASYALAEARMALQKAELAGSSDLGRYCHDERKALEKARLRLRLTEEKTQAVRQWRSRILKEVDEFRGHLTRLREYLGGEFQQAFTTLERMATALERYAELQRLATADDLPPFLFDTTSAEPGDAAPHQEDIATASQGAAEDTHNVLESQPVSEPTGSTISINAERDLPPSLEAEHESV
jgi:hypothetical protein